MADYLSSNLINKMTITHMLPLERLAFQSVIPRADVFDRNIYRVCVCVCVSTKERERSPFPESIWLTSPLLILLLLLSLSLSAITSLLLPTCFKWRWVCVESSSSLLSSVCVCVCGYLPTRSHAHTPPRGVWPEVPLSIAEIHTLAQTHSYGTHTDTKRGEILQRGL